MPHIAFLAKYALVEILLLLGVKMLLGRLHKNQQSAELTEQAEKPAKEAVL